MLVVLEGSASSKLGLRSGPPYNRDRGTRINGAQFRVSGVGGPNIFLQLCRRNGCCQDVPGPIKAPFGKPGRWQRGRGPHLQACHVSRLCCFALEALCCPSCRPGPKEQMVMHTACNGSVPSLVQLSIMDCSVLPETLKPKAHKPSTP